MADPPAPPNDRAGLVATAGDLGRHLIGALPPAFLGLVLLNVAFLTLVFWFLSSQIDQRTALVGKLLEHCMATADKTSDLGAIQARQDALEHDIRALEAKQDRR
jgi:hypothetical protein